MKLFLSLALLATAEAFAPSGFARTQTQLAARVESASLVEEALAASKKFGASSSEARLAWEAVEEVDSADNSEAMKGSLDDCDVENVSSDCLEYSAKLEELQSLLDAQQPVLAQLQSVADEVKQVKLASPKSKVSADSPQLEAALAEAKKITEEKGIKSSEAVIAWETVEEIASADNGNAMGDVLTADECLVDAAKEACVALEELNRVIKSQKE